MVCGQIDKSGTVSAAQAATEKDAPVNRINVADSAHVVVRQSLIARVIAMARFV